APRCPGSGRGSDERRSNSMSGKMIFSETRIALPMAVARWTWKRSIAARISSRLLVGACTTAAVPAHATTARLVGRGVPGREGRGRGLGGGQSVREDVGGPHGAGDVHGEDDRVVVGGQGDNGARPRHREEHRDDR